MAKETLYFTHDYGARNDPKMINLQIKHGMEGVGCYWCIVEMLYENGGDIPLEYERISFVLRTNEETIRSIINDFGLFIFYDGFLSSNSVLDRIEIRNAKSIKARESVNKRWEEHRKNTNVLKNDTNVRKNDTIKERKESKVKEIKENTFDFENTKKILLSVEELSWRETLQMITVFKNENICNKKISEFLLIQNANNKFPCDIGETKKHCLNWLRLQKPETNNEDALEKKMIRY